jgi:hypothetical protein
MELSAAQAKALLGIYSAAVDHHDTSKPEVTHDLDKLENSALANGGAGVLRETLNSPLLAQLVMAALAALLAKLTAPKSPVVQPPPPVTPPPAVSSGPAVLVPDKITLALASVSGPQRTGAKTLNYRLEQSGKILLLGDETSLDDGSILNFDAGISAGALDLRVDLDPAKTPPGETNHPEFLGKIKFIAEDATTGELLGSIGGPDASIRSKTDYTDAKVDKGVAFVPNRWAESGGMSVAVKAKRKGGPIRFYAEIGNVESQGFETPEIR